jgi:hypothetical protein
MQLKKLTRDEMKNVIGGLDPLPPGCYCYTLTGLPLDPDCNLAPNGELYCAPDQAFCC